MATYAPQLLSGSTNGRPIPVAATATPGTLLHTATSTAGAFDEVYLWVSNVTGTLATLTIEWGGVTDPGSHMVKALDVPAKTTSIPIATGQRVTGGVEIRAFSGTAGALNITGNVNRITP